MKPVLSDFAIVTYDISAVNKIIPSG